MLRGNSMAKRQKTPKQLKIPDAGTPETRRKLTADPVSYMVNGWGKNYRDITALEMACREIRRVFMMEVPLQPRAVDLSAVKGASIPLPLWLSIKRRDIYIPWTKDIGSEKFNVLIKWLIDEVNLTELDRVSNKRKGTSKGVIVHCLTRYGILSGNIKNSPTIC
jgi:hypothetical protein